VDLRISKVSTISTGLCLAFTMTACVVDDASEIRSLEHPEQPGLRRRHLRLRDRSAADPGQTACTTDAECEGEDDGSRCVTPRNASGAKPGRCIPNWWGIGHGWAPGAIATPAPVSFLVLSEDLPTKFLSERCNKKDLGTDNAGRPRDGECRDMNPATLFVVAANLLGKRGVSFVEDRTANYEVWNQPIAGYTVTNTDGGKLKEVTKAWALQELGADKLYATLLAETVVRRGEQKTGRAKITQAGPVTGPTTTETVSITAPGAGATYYVRVRPVTGAATVTVSYEIR
jgi:hypothetical protein